MSPSTIDKMFEISVLFSNKMQVLINFEPIFKKSVHFGPIFEEIANFSRIFEKSVNFEHSVNGRWTHYKGQNLIFGH